MYEIIKAGYLYTTAMDGGNIENAGAIFDDITSV